MSEARIMYFRRPEPWTLRAVGDVALSAAYLEHILKMTIKSVSGISVKDALAELAFKTGEKLRARVLDTARRELGAGDAVVQLEALLERAESAARKRNDYVHGIWAQELDGPHMIRSDGDPT